MTAIAVDPIREVLARLKGVKPAGDGKWSAKCSAHDDRTASLSVSRGNDGRVLLHCHAGCGVDAICSAIGITKADLFPPREDHRGYGAAKKIIAAYPYHDSDGVLVYEVCRYQPKGFRQRRPDGSGGYIWSMEGITRILYRVPELLNSAEDRPDDWVFICEGEKDVDALRVAGLIATCNVGGAGKWRDEYSEVLRGRRVCIIADRDEPGRKHAQAVAASLHGIVAEVKVIEVQP
jgi:putative DNA primase/helicase